MADITLDTSWWIFRKPAIQPDSPRLVIVWAGGIGWLTGKDRRIRRWTVPTDDCIALPTHDFYRDCWVFLSNEQNEVYQCWVALDRYNETTSQEHRKTREEISPQTVVLRHDELAFYRKRR